MSPYSDANRILTDVYRRALSVRRCLRSGSGVAMRGSGQPSAAKPTSNLKHRTSNIAMAEGVRFELTIRHRTYGLTNLPMKMTS